MDIIFLNDILYKYTDVTLLYSVNIMNFLINPPPLPSSTSLQVSTKLYI